MPTFRASPSGNLVSSIKRLMASYGGPNPLQLAQADALAAQTARNTSLAEKARQDVLDAQAADAARNDPKLATEYGARVAGLTDPQATRLSQYLKGALQPGSAATMQGDLGGLSSDAAAAIPDQPVTMPADVTDTQRRAFSTALATLLANRLATGKTNVQQLTAGEGNLQNQDLQRQAVAAPDAATENAIVSAISGKLRAPFRVGSQGQVVNQETGGVNEGTQTNVAERALTGAKTTTEGAKQSNLGARTELAGAQTDLANARTTAVRSGATDKGGKRVSPQQVERWVSEVARKEWEAMPARERMGMSYAQHLAKVRERFRNAPSDGIDAKQEVIDAQDAIKQGADPVKVKARFKKRMGFDLPSLDTKE